MSSRLKINGKNYNLVHCERQKKLNVRPNCIIIVTITSTATVIIIIMFLIGKL